MRLSREEVTRLRYLRRGRRVIRLRQGYGGQLGEQTSEVRSQRADAFSRMIFRSETFTAFELENTLATSGSKTITFVPCA